RFGMAKPSMPSKGSKSSMISTSSTSIAFVMYRRGCFVFISLVALQVTLAIDAAGRGIGRRCPPDIIRRRTADDLLIMNRSRRLDRRPRHRRDENSPLAITDWRGLVAIKSRRYSRPRTLLISNVARNKSDLSINSLDGSNGSSFAEEQNVARHHAPPQYDVLAPLVQVAE